MNFEKYVKTCWNVALANYEFDGFKPRLIVNVATGRKYWSLFSLIINTELGVEDPAIKEIDRSLYGYTFPLIDRFISELEVVLSDIYQIPIKLNKPKK